MHSSWKCIGWRFWTDNIGTYNAVLLNVALLIRKRRLTTFGVIVINNDSSLSRFPNLHNNQATIKFPFYVISFRFLHHFICVINQVSVGLVNLDVHVHRCVIKRSLKAKRDIVDFVRVHVGATITGNFSLLRRRMDLITMFIFLSRR